MGKKDNRQEILDEIDYFLDSHSEIFNNIREEWEHYNVIKPIDGEQDFKCNDCGNCCSCEEFWIYTYALDFSRWLEEERYDILCSLFPMIDEEDHIGYGFPSQRVFLEKIQEIFEDKTMEQSVKNAFKRIKDTITRFNSSFDANSDYCIFYNPKLEKHCMIYETRPFSCRTYPFDNKNFSRIDIAKELEEKYGLENDTGNVDIMCPPECFSQKDPKKPTKCSDEDLYSVMVDKVNYLTSTILEDEFDYDVTTLLLEAFSSQVHIPHNKNKSDSIEDNMDKKKNDSNIVKMTFVPDSSKKNKGNQRRSSKKK